MAEINLESLMAKKKTEAQTQAVAVVEPAKEIEAVTQQVETLTPAELAKVQSIKDSIDMTESSTILSFGAPAQKEIAQFSDSILTKVRTKDSGEVGTLLNDLVGKVKGFDVTQKEDDSFISRIPIIGSLVGKAENKIDSLMQGYEKLSTQVEKIQAGFQNDGRCRNVRHAVQKKFGLLQAVATVHSRRRRKTRRNAHENSSGTARAGSGFGRPDGGASRQRF